MTVLKSQKSRKIRNDPLSDRSEEGSTGDHADPVLMQNLIKTRNTKMTRVEIKSHPEILFFHSSGIIYQEFSKGRIQVSLPVERSLQIF